QVGYLAAPVERYFFRPHRVELDHHALAAGALEVGGEVRRRLVVEERRHQARVGAAAASVDQVLERVVHRVVRGAAALGGAGGEREFAFQLLGGRIGEDENRRGDRPADTRVVEHAPQIVLLDDEGRLEEERARPDEGDSDGAPRQGCEQIDGARVEPQLHRVATQHDVFHGGRRGRQRRKVLELIEHTVVRRLLGEERHGDYGGDGGHGTSRFGGSRHGD